MQHFGLATYLQQGSSAIAQPDGQKHLESAGHGHSSWDRRTAQAVAPYAGMAGRYALNFIAKLVICHLQAIPTQLLATSRVHDTAGIQQARLTKAGNVSSRHMGSACAGAPEHSLLHNSCIPVRAPAAGRHWPASPAPHQPQSLVQPQSLLLGRSARRPSVAATMSTTLAHMAAVVETTLTRATRRTTRGRTCPPAARHLGDRR